MSRSPEIVIDNPRGNGYSSFQMAIEAQELPLAVMDGHHCEGCPRLKNVDSRSAYPPPIRESCPRDYSMDELGSNTTIDKLAESARKYQLSFRDVKYDRITHSSCIALTCPNGPYEGTSLFAGSLLVYTSASQELVDRFIEKLPGGMIQEKLEL